LFAPELIRFLIEPPRKEAQYSDMNDVKWNWLSQSDYEKHRVNGELMPPVRFVY
jgi:hypothetical protein